MSAPVVNLAQLLNAGQVSAGSHRPVPPAIARARWLRWLTGSRANINELGSYHHKQGAASLEDMAIRCCVKNINQFGQEHLEVIPWEIARKLWQAARKGGFDSLRGWKLFRTCYPDEDDQIIKRHKLLISTPSVTLDNIAVEVSSANFAFLTSLALTNVNISRAHLMHIPKIVNLVQLLVHNVTYPMSNGGSGSLLTPSPLDATIVRAWSRSVEAGAFTKLRAMALVDKHMWGLELLHTLVPFPELVLCGMATDPNRDPNVWNESIEEDLKWKPLGRTAPDVEHELTTAIHDWTQGVSTLHKALHCILNKSFSIGTSVLSKTEQPSRPDPSTLSVSYGVPHFRISILGQPDMMWCFREELPSAPIVRQRSPTMDEAVPGSKKPRIRGGKAMSLEQALGGF